MYQAHFGLHELPFTITPDTSFFFARSSHQEALNTLLVAMRSGEGFITVTGEVGTGKTLLCRKFLSALDHRDFVTAYIPNPYLQPMTLLLAVADELSLSCAPDINQHQLLKLLTRYLIDAYAEHKRVVLYLQEVEFYLSHRMQVAGSREPQVFAASAAKRVFKATRGVPRLINIVAHKALLAAFGEGSRGIEERHVAAAIDDTESLAHRSWLGRLMRYVVGSTALVVIGVAILQRSLWA